MMNRYSCDAQYRQLLWDEAKVADLRREQGHAQAYIYSSETVGCVATVELESEDICIISVAQSGVLIRSYRRDYQCALLALSLVQHYTMKSSHTQ